MVDEWRVIAHELEVAFGLEGAAGVLDNLAHAALDQVQSFAAEGAHRALQLAALCNHVGGFASVDHGHRDHCRLDRALVARDDGLQGLHDCARHRHRVDAHVRQRGMGALAADRDLELVRTGEDRARPHADLPDRHARPVVRAEDGLHREFLEQAFLDHLACTAAALFSRLEDQIDRAVEVALARQVLGRRQQHGGVAVVAAGVHLAGVLAGVGEPVAFCHRQRVHVRAQAHGAIRSAVLDDAHHARRAQAAVHRDAPVGQRLRDQVAGALLLEAQLWVGVDVAAQRGDG